MQEDVVKTLTGLKWNVYHQKPLQNLVFVEICQNLVPTLTCLTWASVMICLFGSVQREEGFVLMQQVQPIRISDLTKFLILNLTTRSSSVVRIFASMPNI